MKECPNLKKCPVFNDELESKPGLVKTFKRIYCQDEFEKCARFIIRESIGRECVPKNLFPNQNDKVAQIIKDAQKEN